MAFEFKGVLIENPNLDEMGMNEVNPREYYKELTIDYGYYDYVLKAEIHKNELWIYNMKERKQRKYFIDLFVKEGFKANKYQGPWLGDMLLGNKEERKIKEWLRDLGF